LGRKRNIITARKTAVLTWTRGKSGQEDGAAYDGSVALKCREVTTYDASERFRMLIRYKNGTFYDGNLENNT
jgi:hypothetical protein